MPKRFALAPALLCATALGQQTIGHVSLQDAMLTGTLEVSGGEATLRGGASIVARDHTAVLALNRGGSVSVCSTSSLHVTTGSGDQAPLLFALDRGAMEIRTLVEPRDAVITPDLRISARGAGRLDLRVRVVSNGDTCVENRGTGAPALDIVEQFGDGVYQIAGGQHVLFEHGSVHEVVDKESSPCGCPPTPVMSLAENGVTVAPGQAARAGSEAARSREEHPFPAAQSQGLAPTGVIQKPQTPAGQTHAQVSATMAYGGDKDASETEAKAARSSQPATPSGAPSAVTPGEAGAAGGAGSTGGTRSRRPGLPAASSSGAPAEGSSASSPAGVRGEAKPVEVKAPPPPAPPGAKDLAHRIGRFFKRIFGAH